MHFPAKRAETSSVAVLRSLHDKRVGWTLASLPALMGFASLSRHPGNRSSQIGGCRTRRCLATPTKQGSRNRNRYNPLFSQTFLTIRNQELSARRTRTPQSIHRFSTGPTRWFLGQLCEGDRILQWFRGGSFPQAADRSEFGGLCQRNESAAGEGGVSRRGVPPKGRWGNSCPGRSSTRSACCRRRAAPPTGGRSSRRSSTRTGGRKSPHNPGP